MNDYSPEEVASIVESVINRKTDDKTIYSFGDATLLHYVADIVYENLGPQDYAEFLTALKGKMYDEFIGEDGSDIETLHTFISACRKCDDVKPEPILPMWNVEDPKILLVGTTPLQQDDGTKLLVTAMKDAGLSSSDVAATSVARCLPANKKLSGETYANCSSRFLFKEIVYLKPRVIVPLGTIAFSTLTMKKNSKITEEAGNWHHIGPWSIMPTYDPSYATRSKKNTELFGHHIKEAKSKAIPS